MSDVAREGRTVLFVSHNMDAVRTLCTRTLIIKSGNLCFDGVVEEGVRTYLGETEVETAEATWPTPNAAPGDDVLRLKLARIRSGGTVTSNVDIDKPVQIEIEYWVLRAVPLTSVSIHLNYAGSCAFVGGNSSVKHDPGLYCVSFTIPANLLNSGIYSVTIFLITDVTVFRVVERDVISFNVQEIEEREYVGSIIGFVRPRLDWEPSKFMTK